jgi:hypothetical protein
LLSRCVCVDDDGWIGEWWIGRAKNPKVERRRIEALIYVSLAKGGMDGGLTSHTRARRGRGGVVEMG